MKLFFLHILLFGAYVSQAQNTNFGTFDPPHFVNLTEKNGLVGKNALCFSQDKQGYMWIGTNEGLTRYDGQHCLNFTHQQEDSTSLSANYINDLATDDDGWIWVASIGGFDAYLPDKQLFKHYKNNLKGAYAKSVLPENKDWIWVGTMNRDNYEGGGLHLLNKHTGECAYWKITDFFPLKKEIDFEFKFNSVTDIVRDENNKNLLWVATETGVALFDISQFKFINFWRVPAMNLAQYQYVTSILSEKNGNVWVGVWGLGLYNFTPKNGQWQYVEIKPDIKDNFKIVASLAHKNDDELLVGSTYGVITLDKNTFKTTLWEHDFRDAESIVGYLTWQIFQDKTGIFWFGMGGGVSRWDKHHNLASFFYPNPILKINPNVFQVTGMCDDAKHNRILQTLNSGENIYIIDYQRNTHKIIRYFQWKDKTKDPKFFQVSHGDRRGNFWLYSEGQLFCIKSGTNKIEPIKTFDKAFLKANKPNLNIFHEDKKGNFWLVGQEDIFYLNIDNQLIKHYNIKKYVLPNISPTDNITDFTTDSEGKGFATTSAGLIVVQNESLLQFQPFEDKNKDGKNTMRSLCFDENKNLYIAIANQGLIKCCFENELLKIEKTTQNKDFIWNENLFKLRFHKGKVWVISSKGMVCFDPISEEKQYFNASHGLQHGGRTPCLGTGQTMVISPFGKILFSTEHGQLGWFSPDEILQRKDTTPTIRFNEISVFGKKVNLSQQIDFLHDIYLAYKENFFTVAFSAVHFSNVEDIKYAYQLDGIDGDWVESDKPSANYTNIKAGNYRFRVKAQNRAGEWSQERVLRIHVEPPFWEKTWFRLLTLFSIIASLFAFYKYRIFQLKEKNRIEKLALQSEVKALRAQMNPHFMFNALNTVKSYVLSNKPLEAAEYLSDFAYLLRQTLQQSREQLISLKDDLETLQLYIRLEQTRFSENFDIQYVIDENLPLEDIFIPPMILQPYVENAIKHGLPTKKNQGILRLEISAEKDQLLCVIDDNGAGRQAKNGNAQSHKSLGMEITNERVQIHNQLNDLGLDIKIIDKTNENGEAEGTRVEVRMNI